MTIAGRCRSSQDRHSGGIQSATSRLRLRVGAACARPPALYGSGLDLVSRKALTPPGPPDVGERSAKKFCPKLFDRHRAVGCLARCRNAGAASPALRRGSPASAAVSSAAGRCPLEQAVRSAELRQRGAIVPVQGRRLRSMAARGGTFRQANGVVRRRSASAGMGPPRRCQASSKTPAVIDRAFRALLVPAADGRGRSARPS